MIVGCYTLHLYCDFAYVKHPYDAFPVVYTHERGSVCRAAARRDGWLLTPDGTAMCPECVATPRRRWATGGTGWVVSHSVTASVTIEMYGVLRSFHGGVDYGL